MLSDGYDPVVFGCFCLAGDDDPGLDSMYFFETCVYFFVAEPPAKKARVAEDAASSGESDEELLPAVEFPVCGLPLPTVRCRFPFFSVLLFFVLQINKEEPEEETTWLSEERFPCGVSLWQKPVDFM